MSHPWSPDPERLVDEMRRVCKPDGQIVFVNHFHSRNPLLGRFENLIAPLSEQLGFRPDFSLDRFMDQTGLDATDDRPVNLFRFLHDGGGQKQQAVRT